MAFLVSFQVLSYELALFHILNYIYSYIHGVLGLSLALGGLAAGAAWAGRLQCSHYAVMRTLTLFNLGLLAVPSICLLAIPAWLKMALLGLPFAPAGTLLALLFASRSAPRLYAADLLGAGCAAATFPWLWPALGQENLAPLLASAGFFCLSLGAASQPKLPGRGRFGVAGGLLCLLASLAVWSNFRLEIINFATILPADSNFSGKVYNLTRQQREVVVSRCDLVQRLDLLAAPYGAVGKEFLETYHDGLRVDVIHNGPGTPRDVRLAGCLGMIQPKILLIGSAAQGVVKPAKLLAGAGVTALEINQATITLMQTDMFVFSRMAYRDLDLRKVDGRTFLESPGSDYDLITLLNTHTVHNIGEALYPDFLHTREALEVALSRLTPRGFLSLEERNPNSNSQKSIDSLLTSILEALHASGRRPAAAHVLIYEWYGYLHQDPSEDHFLQILVRNQPFSQAEVDYVRGFEGARLIPPNQSTSSMPALRLLYAPQSSRPSRYRSRIEAWQREKETYPAHISQAATSDDRPYAAGILNAQAREWAWLTGFIGAGALAWLIGADRRFLCCALGGLASSLLQTLLLQRLQLVTGSPASALVFVLGGMLMAGGLGSWWLGQRRLSKWPRVMAVLSGSLAAGLVLALPLQWVCPLQFVWRVAVVGVAVAPLAFVLGSFLPALALLSERDVTRLFAISALAGATATPTCLAVSLSWGHGAALGLAGLAALVASLLWPSGLYLEQAEVLISESTT